MDPKKAKAKRNMRFGDAKNKNTVRLDCVKAIKRSWGLPLRKNKLWGEVGEKEREEREREGERSKNQRQAEPQLSWTRFWNMKDSRRGQEGKTWIVKHL